MTNSVPTLETVKATILFAGIFLLISIKCKEKREELVFERLYKIIKN